MNGCHDCHSQGDGILSEDEGELVRIKLRPSELGGLGSWDGRREGRGRSVGGATKAVVPGKGRYTGTRNTARTGRGELAQPARPGGPLSQPHVYSSLPT